MTPDIENQLSELEARHKRHQKMLFLHHEAKHTRREKHRSRGRIRKMIPILFI